jgi:hypothetical protein
MHGWDWAFFKPGTFRPDPQKTAEWNRGAYLAAKHATLLNDSPVRNSARAELPHTRKLVLNLALRLVAERATPGP